MKNRKKMPEHKDMETKIFCVCFYGQTFYGFYGKWYIGPTDHSILTGRINFTVKNGNKFSA